MKYEIRGQITLEDYKKVLKFNRKNGLLLLIWLICVPIALYSIVGALRQGSIISIFFTLLPAVLIAYLMMVYVPNYPKRIYQQQKSLHLPFHIEFSESLVSFQNEAAKYEYSWGSFDRWQ